VAILVIVGIVREPFLGAEGKSGNISRLEQSIDSILRDGRGVMGVSSSKVKAPLLLVPLRTLVWMLWIGVTGREEIIVAVGIIRFSYSLHLFSVICVSRRDFSFAYILLYQLSFKLFFFLPLEVSIVCKVSTA